MRRSRLTLIAKQGLGASAMACVISCVKLGAASPEWHVGLEPGVALEFPESDSRFAFRGAVVGDLVFGRERSHQLGWGPSVEVATRAFSDARFSGLGQVVLPAGNLHLAIALGPQLRAGTEATSAIASRAFIGYRAFNHTYAYGTAFGVAAGLDHPLTGAAATWSLGVHLDAMWMSLPFLALATWLRGAD